MTREEARGIIKSECYIFDPLNLDRSTMVNTALDMAIIALEQEEIVRCKDCKHRPVDTGKQIEPPEENGRIDETCPCINADDWWYSFMPEDDYFCADGERKA